MQGLIVFFIVLFACSLGSVSGIGGGIIIKPLMDAMGGFSAASVNAMASVTVLTMTTVSIIKSRENARGINWLIVLFFAVGSMVGGVVGNTMLAKFIANAANDAIVTIVQSIFQILLVLLVILNEFIGQKIPHYHIKNPGIMMFIGIFLGIIAAFLSIGGGLFNRPLLIILVSMASKTAVFSSLCIIFFAQASNVITMGITTHFSNIDLHVMGFMMIAAVLGGYIGGTIATKVNEKYFDRLFLMTLVVILGLNIFNLMRYII